MSSRRSNRRVVDAAVPTAGVRVLDGDRAIVVAFLHQRAARGADGQQVIAPARVVVNAHRIDGTWKIAGVESR